MKTIKETLVNETGFEAMENKLRKLKSEFDFVLATAPHDRKRVYDLISEMANLERTLNKIAGL